MLDRGINQSGVDGEVMVVSDGDEDGVEERGEVRPKAMPPEARPRPRVRGRGRGRGKGRGRKTSEEDGRTGSRLKKRRKSAADAPVVAIVEFGARPKRRRGSELPLVEQKDEVGRGRLFSLGEGMKSFLSDVGKRPESGTAASVASRLQTRKREAKTLSQVSRKRPGSAEVVNLDSDSSSEAVEVKEKVMKGSGRRRGGVVRADEREKNDIEEIVKMDVEDGKDEGLVLCDGFVKGPGQIIGKPKATRKPLSRERLMGRANGMKLDSDRADNKVKGKETGREVPEHSWMKKVSSVDWKVDLPWTHKYQDRDLPDAQLRASRSESGVLKRGEQDRDHIRERAASAAERRRRIEEKEKNELQMRGGREDHEIEGRMDSTRAETIVLQPKTEKTEELFPKGTDAGKDTTQEDLGVGSTGEPAKGKTWESPDQAEDQAVELRCLFEFPPGQRGAIQVTTEEVRRLQPKKYLNDSLVDFCIKLIELDERFCNKNGANRCLFFNSFFFHRLAQSIQSSSHDGIARWTQEVDIFTKELIFVPICDAFHWSLAVVVNLPLLPLCLEKGTIEDHEGRGRPAIIYSDSMNISRGTSFARVLKQYLFREWKHRKSPEMDEETEADLEKLFKKIPLMCGRVPPQRNEYDCGLYVINNIIAMLENYDGLLTGMSTKNRSNQCHIYDLPEILNLRMELRQKIEGFEKVHLLKRDPNALKEILEGKDTVNESGFLSEIVGDVPSHRVVSNPGAEGVGCGISDIQQEKSITQEDFKENDTTTGEQEKHSADGGNGDDKNRPGFRQSVESYTLHMGPGISVRYAEIQSHSEEQESNEENGEFPILLKVREDESVSDGPSRSKKAALDFQDGCIRPMGGDGVVTGIDGEDENEIEKKGESNEDTEAADLSMDMATVQGRCIQVKVDKNEESNGDTERPRDALQGAVEASATAQGPTKFPAE